jgi:hypothetical protein
MTPLSARTTYGTVVEILKEAGCGLLLVKKPRDDSVLVCHVSALTGVTPEDAVALRWLTKNW